MWKVTILFVNYGVCSIENALIFIITRFSFAYSMALGIQLKWTETFNFLYLSLLFVDMSNLNNISKNFT